MKTAFLIASFLFTLASYSQDTSKVRLVDSLVNLINNSNLKIQRDTIINNRPELGLSMQTYLSMIVDGSELKKYVNNVHFTTKQDGVTKQGETTNTFYFDHNKLIKVEDLAKEGEKQLEFLWYYFEDKPVYYTLRTEKAEERAEFLLTLAKGMVSKMGFK